MTDGTFIKYEDFNFRDSTLKTIDRVNAILEQYRSAMSVRQIHYQFVTHNWYANNDDNYDALVKTISNGRLAGLISWTAIEDRNRFLQGVNFFPNPHNALKRVRDLYKINLWSDQEWRPVVLSEKASTEGTISEICLELRVDFLSLRGYNSQSMAWELGQRFQRDIRNGQRPIVFHVGDHDPSGQDMTRDNRRRLNLFTGYPVILQRLALNMDQIDKYKPPPNPVKKTDKRWRAYAAEFDTESSWEVDALEPPVLKQIIRDAVMQIRDEKKWNARLAQEVEDIRFIDDLIAGPSLSEEPEDED